MRIIEPHIHMTSRTTDDYAAMYGAGIRACVEPSFWLGVNRSCAGSFLDSWRLALEFETVRAARFGIDHYAGVAMNPKEAEDRTLAREVIAAIPDSLEHERCVVLGEIGLNNITAAEEAVFLAQAALAQGREIPVMIHLPHFEKPKGVARILAMLKELDLPPERVLIDHNTEDTMPLLADSPYWLGMTVYPISKLTPQRVSAMVKRYGAERILVNGSADWGVSDPLSLPKVVEYMRNDGHDDAAIRRLVFENANAFYSHSPHWQPRLDLEPVDPREFQR